MKKSGHQRKYGKNYMELLEEGTYLLRKVPVDALLCYYLGTMPFVGSLLFFWADMSKSAAADQHLLSASLLLSLLFIWMKCWQALFARKLASFLVEDAAPQFSLKKIVGIALLQAAVMPWGLMVLPVAFVISLPFAWCYAFFQNLTVLSWDAGADLKGIMAKSWKQAGLWPGQNHLLIIVIFFFSLFVFVNIATALLVIPQLMKTLLGIDTMFTRSNFHLLNSTFWFSVLALTYLCIDPFVKGVYVVRCHYGQSLSSGEDLITELRRVVRHKGQVIRKFSVLLLASSLFFTAIPSWGVPSAGSATAAARPLSPGELDRSVERVIKGVEFSWRTPRVKGAMEEPKKDGFASQVLKFLGKWLKKGFRLIGRFFEWLAKLLPRATMDEKARMAKGAGGADALYLFIYVILAALLSVGGIILWRRLQRRKQNQNDLPVESAVAVIPDVADENVSAGDFTGDSWLSLARNLFGQGDGRLGMRALYFASLNRLADGNLLVLAKFKSNHEYERELLRRAHVMPEVTRSFAENLVLLERTWYGMYPVQEEMISTFWQNYERIADHVQKK